MIGHRSNVAISTSGNAPKGGSNAIFADQSSSIIVSGGSANTTGQDGYAVAAGGAASVQLTGTQITVTDAGAGGIVANGTGSTITASGVFSWRPRTHHATNAAIANAATAASSASHRSFIHRRSRDTRWRTRAAGTFSSSAIVSSFSPSPSRAIQSSVCFASRVDGVERCAYDAPQLRGEIFSHFPPQRFFDNDGNARHCPSGRSAES